MDSNLKARAQKIKLVIFDVDGVMTDGSLFIGDDGQEYINVMLFSTIWRMVSMERGNLFKEMKMFNK